MERGSFGLVRVVGSVQARRRSGFRPGCSWMVVGEGRFRGERKSVWGMRGFCFGKELMRSTDNGSQGLAKSPPVNGSQGLVKSEVIPQQKTEKSDEREHSADPNPANTPNTNSEEAKSEEKKTEKTKSDSKMRWIFIKTLVKYAIRGIFGAGIAWIFGWFPEPVQYLLDEPLAKDSFRNSTHQIDLENYIERPEIDVLLSSLIGNLSVFTNQAIIIVGEQQTGKTTALDRAVHNQPMVIRISAKTASNEDEFGKLLFQTIGLWHAPISLNSAFVFFAKLCKQAASKGNGVIPTLIIEDLNLDKGREELVNNLLTHARNLSADQNCCRVIITVTDAVSASDLQKAINEKGKIKFLYFGDFTEQEATQFLARGSRILPKIKHKKPGTPAIQWNVTKQQQQMILDTVGCRPGELMRTLEDIDRLIGSSIKMESVTSGPIEVPNAIIDQVLRDLKSDASVTLDTAISLFPECASALKTLASKPFGTTLSASEARKQFLTAPEDKNGKLVQVLLNKKILSWNLLRGTVHINTKLMWHTIRSTKL